jgi:hypothetical protein
LLLARIWSSLYFIMFLGELYYVRKQNIYIFCRDYMSCEIWEFWYYGYDSCWFVWYNAGCFSKYAPTLCRYQVRTQNRGLLVASRGQFSDKGYVRVASRVVNPLDKGKYELRPAVSWKVWQLCTRLLGKNLTAVVWNRIQGALVRCPSAALYSGWNWSTDGQNSNYSIPLSQNAKPTWGV